MTATSRPMMAMISVEVQPVLEATDGLPSEPQFHAWVTAAAMDQRPSAEVLIRIVDEAESRELNHSYRGKDSATNVLSFPADETPPGLPADLHPPSIGDLVICAEVVRREADDQHKPLMHHWAHMVVHGVLHLLGYDHIRDEEAELMEQREREILAGLDIPDPYQ